MKKGDRIAIAAPAGPFKRQAFLRGVHLLKKTPFEVFFHPDIYAQHHYLAGEDKRRLKELRDHLADPSLKALLFARGGFGTQRLLPSLRPKCTPKVVVGSSDLTVLLNFLWKKYRLPSYYGPMVAPHLTLPENVSRLYRALTNPDFFKSQRLVAKKILNPGEAKGVLIGGCLSLLTSTLGTPWEFDTRGSILFLEDTHESSYRVDRMLTQLEQAGKLKSVRGIVFGTFRQGQTYFPSKIQAVVREKLKTFKGPVLWGLRFGHHPRPLIIPFGGTGHIHGNQLKIIKGIF